MTSKSRPIHISWSELEHMTARLARIIKKSGWKPQYLVGITVSGLYPLALIAEEFKTKDVAVVSARSYSARRQGKLHITALPKVNLRGKRVLLIDEITDRGTTLQKVSDILRKKYKVKELRTATLVVNKKHCEFWPDYSVRTVDRWVVFPWDK